MKKSITQKIEAKNNALAKALETANEDTKLFFDAEVNENLARGVQMDIIKSNIGTKAGRDTLKEIGKIKLDHQGKDSADSFVRHIAKLIREGVIKQPKQGGDDISLKNSKKNGVNWSKKRPTATTDKPKADNKPEQVDKAKVKADILKLLAKLPLADRVVMVNELSADVGADKAVATLGGAGAKPKAKTKKVA